MKHAFRAVAATLALALSAAVAAAAPVTYNVDKNHTEVGFEVRHFFSKVHGRFTDFEGTIVFDEANPKNISINATAQAKSVTTNNERRDADLRSSNFFAADTFPVISFKSTSVTPAGKNKYKVTGDFTLRGVTRPVTFDGEFLGAAAVGVGGQAWGTKAGFAATTVINRQDFGVKWNKVLDNGGTMVDDNVTIELNIEADKAEAKK